MEWIAFGTVVALAWWCWRRTRERASERKAARERQDLLERNIRLTTTRSLNEAKAEIGTLKDRMSRLTESYKDARTEIATLKKRQITAREGARLPLEQRLPRRPRKNFRVTKAQPRQQRDELRNANDAVVEERWRTATSASARAGSEAATQSTEPEIAQSLAPSGTLIRGGPRARRPVALPPR